MIHEIFSKKDHNNPPVLLWGIKASPYVRKVMVALAEKNIAFEQNEILPKVLLEATSQSVPTEFNHASPLGKIPALKIGDTYIADSAVIAGYLDRQFSTDNPLYPKDPKAYALALWFENYSDTTFSEVAYKKVFVECVIKPKILNQIGDTAGAQHALSNTLPPMLDYLTQSIEKNPWLAGNDFSMADVAIATQLLALQMAGFELLEKRWEKLKDYLEKVISRPSFKEVIA